MNKTPAPLDAIGAILSQAMELAVANGANSVSMPDEYVAVAHFLAYPSEYALPETIHAIAVPDEKLGQHEAPVLASGAMSSINN